MIPFPPMASSLADSVARDRAAVEASGRTWRETDPAVWRIVASVLTDCARRGVSRYDEHACDATTPVDGR